MKLFGGMMVVVLSVWIGMSLQTTTAPSTKSPTTALTPTAASTKSPTTTTITTAPSTKSPSTALTTTAASTKSPTTTPTTTAPSTKSPSTALKTTAASTKSPSTALKTIAASTKSPTTTPTTTSPSTKSPSTAQTCGFQRVKFGFLPETTQGQRIKLICTRGKPLGGRWKAGVGICHPSVSAKNNESLYCGCKGAEMTFRRTSHHPRDARFGENVTLPCPFGWYVRENPGKATVHKVVLLCDENTGNWKPPRVTCYATKKDPGPGQRSRSPAKQTLIRRISLMLFLSLTGELV